MGANHSTGTNQFSTRRLSEFEPENEAFKAISKAIERVNLPERTIPSGRCDLILAPEAVGAFVSYLISPMVTGKSIQLGVSCLTDMSDKAVAADCFSLIDDGRVEGGLGSATIDDEGTTTKSTTIVEKGVLRNFLYDTLTACVVGAVSTGNARRLSETLGRTYLAPPEPLPTNLIVRNGDYSPEELVEETGKGVQIDSFDYTFPLVPERGYFSIMSSSPALVIEKGVVVGHARNLAFQGELKEVLMKICGVGRYARQSIHIGSLATSCPHVKMREVALAKSH
jgi:PmbA protein